MIQNIQDYKENKDSESDTILEKFNFRESFLKLFTIPNIIIYTLSLMISMVSLGTNSQMIIAPFGLALVFASVSAGMPIIMVYLLSLIGTAIKFGASSTFMYIAISVIIFVLILIRKPMRNLEKSEQLNLGGYLFFATLLVSIIKMLFNSFYVYDLIVAFTLSITTYIFYKIFVNSISVIKDYREKSVFSIEEVIGASMLVTIAVSAFGETSIFGFSIRNIVCIFVVLMLGYKNGILVGGISGIVVGIVLGIIGNSTPEIIATYAISGMLAGFLNRFGKIGVIIGFLLGDIIITYVQNGGTSNIIRYQEILISAIGLLAIPKNIILDINDILPKTKLLPESSKEIEEGSDAILKLNTISKTIENMSKNNYTHQSYEDNLDLFEDEIQKQIADMESNILYDYFQENNNNFIGDIFDNIIDNGVLTENGLTSVLAKHNIYIMKSQNPETKLKEEQEYRNIIKAVNSAYHVCKTNAIWQKKSEEAKQNMNAELNNVKQAIDDITANLTNQDVEKNKYKNKEIEIARILNDNNIPINNISINQESSGKFIVKVYTNICDDENGKTCPIKKIKREIEKSLSENFVLQKQECGLRKNKNICEFTYMSQDKYIMQIGISKTKMENSMISGDMVSSVKLSDGKYLLAISDGMGTGADAKKNSSIAISMLENLLTSGFNNETSINLINSAIITANKEEKYATLDIEILDLYEGKMEILKNGACPTYIKHSGDVIMIKSNSLPAGVVNNFKIDSYDKQLENGDIVVICSDGIIESNKEYENRDLWLKHLLEEINTDSPQRIADIILKESVDNDFGKPNDDMTVVVFKVNQI